AWCRFKLLELARVWADAAEVEERATEFLIVRRGIDFAVQCRCLGIWLRGVSVSVTAIVLCGVLFRAAVRFAMYPVICEVAPQRIGRSRKIGQCDIGVWPDQVERGLGEASLFAFRPPWEHMEWQVAFLAPGTHLRTRGAIDVDLPDHRL